MDSRHGKKRLHVEDDRLSSLPDDLIHKILAFIDIRDAIGSSELSSRWRFIWTSMPYLNFSTEDFDTLLDFSKFVTNVLSRRNGLTEVYSVKLSFRGRVSQVFVKRILKYAFSHNVQQLNVVFLLERVIEFPLTIFRSGSLKHLSLTMQQGRFSNFTIDRHLTSTWELPTLTTLELHSVTLHDDNAEECIGVFSKCANLKNLTLNDFKIMESDSFSICHPRLSHLTLENGYNGVKLVNVAAPQLQSLTIRFCYAEHVISAPDLASLLYKGCHPLHLSTDGFHDLKKANICVSSPRDEDAHQIVSLLQQLHNVHFLSLSLEIIEILSSSVDLILHQPSPFVNLKSLNIYPEIVYLSEQAHKKVTIMSTELKSYLLDSSPGVTFTMVLREEIKAQKIFSEIGEILEKEKANNTKTNRAHLEVESNKKKLKIGGNIAQIKSCWKNMGVQIEKASVIISKLQDIKKLLTKLPASKRANIQPCFATLCAEADIAISKITDGMKIHCEENQSLSSDCFQINLLQHWSHFLSKLSVPVSP